MTWIRIQDPYQNKRILGTRKIQFFGGKMKNKLGKKNM